MTRSTDPVSPGPNGENPPVYPNSWPEPDDDAARHGEPEKNNKQGDA